MEWTKKPTQGGVMPWYYECTNGDVSLELTLPYEYDPWGMRMYKGSTTIVKEYFRLRGKDRNGEWESEDDLLKAQEKAWQIAHDKMADTAAYYENLVQMLDVMKPVEQYAGTKQKEDRRYTAEGLIKQGRSYRQLQDSLKGMRKGDMT